MRQREREVGEREKGERREQERRKVGEKLLYIDLKMYLRFHFVVAKPDCFFCVTF